MATRQSRHTPIQRMCVGTREVHEPQDLIRWFVGPDGTHWPDWTGRTEGRFGKGIYTRRDRVAIDRALARRQLVGEQDVLRARVVDVAERAFWDRLSLACRAGALAIGQTAVRKELRAGLKGGVLIVSLDAGKAGVDRIRPSAQARECAMIDVQQGSRMGAALGRQFVSCLWCRPSAFAENLWQWAPPMVALETSVVGARPPTIEN